VNGDDWLNVEGLLGAEPEAWPNPPPLLLLLGPPKPKGAETLGGSAGAEEPNEKPVDGRELAASLAGV